MNASRNDARSPRRGALIVGVIVLLLAGSSIFGAFGSSSVCNRCGKIRDTRRWEIPLTRVALFSTSSEHETPVSMELVRSGTISEHEHEWLFSSGGGNGVTCALGEGRHIRPAVQSEGVASILATSRRFGEVQFRDRLVKLMFKPKTAEAVRFLGIDVPSVGFTDASEFHKFLDDKMEYFDLLVEPGR